MRKNQRQGTEMEVHGHRRGDLPAAGGAREGCGGKFQGRSKRMPGAPPPPRKGVEVLKE